MTLTRADLEALDRDDPLAGFRSRFSLPEGVIYLDGNSLGVLPKATAARLADVVQREWGMDLIRSWNSAGWIDLPQRVGGLIAGIVGAEPDEVVAADSTSVNLFKLAAAAVRLRPGRRVILSEPGNFPTDLYILQGLAEMLDGQVEVRLAERERLAEALTDEVALLLLTHVHYKTGRVHDMAGLTAAAHRAGALTLWDLSHSAGALDVELNRCNADLAVGCGYKYLNGGPGAPAFLYVARRHQDAVRPPLSGWMGHAAPFDFRDDYAPAPGITRHLCGTPSILGLAALEEGVRIMAEADMAQVRAKSVRMGDLFIQLVGQMCPDAFGLLSPRDGSLRGSQVSLTHPQGHAMVQALIARGVIGDFRAPDVLRFGFTPLYLRYVDVWDASRHLAEVVRSGEWQEERFQARGKVT
ncbi:kynureninase [Indioceanicola profundi]|uniref:kynureninase n=1 Tax=Indioceanicola profundi TaxID=2220096 RepID=UPI0019698043|nr:kynureninase [Indioceanicola profundi]